MRFTIILLAIMTSAAAFATEINVNDWAEASFEGSYEHGSSVSFKLTDAQITAIENAKGKDVEIELTENQIQAIKEATGAEKVNKTITLNSILLRPGNKVALECAIIVGVPPQPPDNPYTLHLEGQPSRIRDHLDKE